MVNTQHLHNLVLEDARSAVASIERHDYDNAYRNAKAVCENLSLLLLEEAYNIIADYLTQEQFQDDLV